MVAGHFGLAMPSASEKVHFAQATVCPIAASLREVGSYPCSSPHTSPPQDDEVVDTKITNLGHDTADIISNTVAAGDMNHSVVNKKVLPDPSTWPWAFIPLAPVDPILASQTLLRADNSGLAVDLCVGAYRNADGEPTELRCITRATQHISQHPPSHGYLPLSGHPALRALSVELLFGDAVTPESVACIQTISGSGALRLALELCRKRLGATTALVSDPSWPNHAAMAAECGLHVWHYAYYDRVQRCVREADLLRDLREAPRGSVVILHACAHNPTGIDLSMRQWTLLADVVVERGLLPLFDLAYQGLASGDLDADAWAVRMFVGRGIPVLAALSFSKTLGLYNSRVGTLQVALPGLGAAAVAATMSQLVWLARAANSSPPAQGARLAATVLGDSELRVAWRTELREMVSRIGRMRKRLREELDEADRVAERVGGEWDFVEQGRGMFVVLGLHSGEVEEMRTKWHVYLAPEGRLNVCGLTERSVGRVARAIVDVLSAREPKVADGLNSSLEERYR